MQGQRPQWNGFSLLCICLCCFRWLKEWAMKAQRRHETSGHWGSRGGEHLVLLPHNMAPHLLALHTTDRLGLATHPWIPGWLNFTLPTWCPAALRCHSAHREVQLGLVS